MGKFFFFFLPETTSPFDPMGKIFTFFFLSELFGIGIKKKSFFSETTNLLEPKQSLVLNTNKMYF